MCIPPHDIKYQVNREIKTALQQPDCMGDGYDLYLSQVAASSCKLVRLLSLQEFE